MQAYTLLTTKQQKVPVSLPSVIHYSQHLTFILPCFWQENSFSYNKFQEAKYETKSDKRKTIIGP